jgi:hypothetical protein
VPLLATFPVGPAGTLGVGSYAVEVVARALAIEVARTIVDVAVKRGLEEEGEHSAQKGTKPREP